MDNKEFVQRLTTIKEKIEAIYKEVRLHNAYIYNQRKYLDFYNQVSKYIWDITYIIDYYGPKNTTDEFKNEVLSEYSGYSELATNMWNDLNIYDYDPDHAKFILIKKDKEKDR